MNKKIPMRQCVGCREMKMKRDLIRVIRTSENELLIDLTGKKNGRGAYICPSLECLQKAMKQKGLERSLKLPIPPEFYTAFQKEIETIETG